MGGREGFAGRRKSMSHILEHPEGRSQGANARMLCRVFEEIGLGSGIGSGEKVLMDQL